MFQDTQQKPASLSAKLLTYEGKKKPLGNNDGEDPNIRLHNSREKAKISFCHVSGHNTETSFTFCRAGCSPLNKVSPQGTMVERIEIPVHKRV